MIRSKALGVGNAVSDESAMLEIQDGVARKDENSYDETPIMEDFSSVNKDSTSAATGNGGVKSRGLLQGNS